MDCCLVGLRTSCVRLKSLTISHIRVAFLELTDGLGLPPSQLIQGKLKSPHCTTWAELGIVAKEPHS